ncbi:MAG: MOSC N-terminal beta barrel domain-containing protein [Gammaproteobacteria bacterium]|nr:MOSC N-terminal beta barrel domain-containing protein [Gammaproteobacteria bacterium]
MPAKVKSLFVDPVKSMQGESCDELTLTESGTAGDRVWAVRDETRGGIRGAKKIASLMQMAAAFTGDVAAKGSSPIRITAPGGEYRDNNASDINQWLSRQLDHEVTLWPLLPPDKLEHYRRGAPDQG